MKRHYIGVLALAALSLTACDERVMEAERLAGEYEGNFGMYYEYTRGGRTYAYDAAYSYLRLDNYAFSMKGEGVQIDYYKYGPYTEIWHKIRWKVQKDAQGRYITFHYLWEKEWDTNIYDYELNEYEFYGFFGTSSKQFYMRNLNPPDGFSWDPYYRHDYGWNLNSGWREGYYGYDGYYYRAPARDSQAEAPAPKELRFGNRFQEQ